MQIVYIHGLNSDHLAEKGQSLRDFCQRHFDDITVHCPNLNLPPQQVVNLLQTLAQQDPNTCWVGSSLGGFFATLMTEKTGQKAVLLNPSTDPASSLKRFFPDNFDDLADDYVAYTTKGGWDITKADILWLAHHRPTSLQQANQLLVILKQGDELLDYQVAQAYYSQPNAQAHLIVEPDGDHKMSDFEEKLPHVLQFLFGQS